MPEVSIQEKDRTILPENVSEAPADLWTRKPDPTGLTIGRWIALIVMIAAPLTGWHSLIALALIAYVLQILTNASRRRSYVHNLNGLPCLSEDAAAAIDASTLPGVTFISPARNEEDGVEASARSVAALDYPNLEIIYVDDHSTDNTPAILDRLTQELPRLRVIHDPPLQEGWLGKANGVWYALGQSDPSSTWVVIADGDVVFHPDALKQAVSIAQENKYDFLTCIAHLDNGSLGEELYMPNAWAALIQGSHYTRLNEARTTPIGIGAFTMVRRSMYLETGGHAAIRNRQPEDTLLAALFKKHGGNMGVCWTHSMIRVRIYRGFSQLRQFIVRKIRMQVQDKISGLINRGAYVLIQDILPLPLFVVAVWQQFHRGHFSISLTMYAFFALLSYLTNVGSYDRVDEVAYMRPGLPWFHPIGGLLRLYFYAVTATQLLFRKRMEWRGRDFTHT